MIQEQSMNSGKQCSHKEFVFKGLEEFADWTDRSVPSEIFRLLEGCFATMSLNHEALTHSLKNKRICKCCLTQFPHQRSIHLVLFVLSSVWVRVCNISKLSQANNTHKLLCVLPTNPTPSPYPHLVFPP